MVPAPGNDSLLPLPHTPPLHASTEPVGADRGETLIQAPSFATLTWASEPLSARHRGKAQNRLVEELAACGCGAIRPPWPVS
jgi:hypothetical protein